MNSIHKVNKGAGPLFALILVAVAGVAIFQGCDSKPRAGQTSQAALYYCPMHPTYTADRPGTCPICNMSLVKKEEATVEKSADAHAGHTGPRAFTVAELLKMKPGEICLLHKCKMGKCMMAMTEEMARLGKCPHCQEDLGIVIKEAAPQGYAKVKLSADKQQVLGVETAPVTRRVIAKTIRAAGRIAYDPELYQAQEEYLQALQSLNKAAATNPEIKEQAAKLLESSQIRLRLLGLSKELIQEIETAGKPDRTLLYSDPGGRVWLYAAIYEYEITLVKVGDKVRVEVPALTGKSFEGVIRAIDSVLDPMSRSVRVRATLENLEGLLKPEMYVNAMLNIDLGEKLAVPAEAVFATGEANVVFVATAEGVFEPRKVTLGVKADDFYEVKNGLGEGELVVTSGNFLIDSESRLTAALEGMGSESGGHQHGS